MARLQNPESQARYARYMVKFVCYVLRFVADAEARLNVQSGSSSSEDSDEDEYGVEGDNKEGDSDDSRAVRHQGSCHRVEKKDLMKDARELFC